MPLIPTTRRKPRKRASVETALSKAITDTLTLKGCTVIRVQSGVLELVGKGGKRRFVHCAPKGTPDRIVLAPNGLTFWLEIKKPGEPLSGSQIDWFEEARAMGHDVFMVTSVAQALTCLDIVRGRTRSAARAVMKAGADEAYAEFREGVGNG